jgi:hypothetical protein
MTGLNHVLTGTAIALAVKQPLLIAPLAFLSHFLLDAVPHFGGTPFHVYGHKHFAKAMATDGLLAITALCTILFFAPALIIPILVGAFFGFLPDVFWLYYYSHHEPQYWFFRFHQAIQWFERPSGAIVEASYFILISTIIFALLLKG